MCSFLSCKLLHHHHNDHEGGWIISRTNQRNQTIQTNILHQTEHVRCERMQVKRISYSLRVSQWLVNDKSLDLQTGQENPRCFWVFLTGFCDRKATNELDPIHTAFLYGQTTTSWQNIVKMWQSISQIEKWDCFSRIRHVSPLTLFNK